MVSKTVLPKLNLVKVIHFIDIEKSTTNEIVKGILLSEVTNSKIVIVILVAWVLGKIFA